MDGVHHVGISGNYSDHTGLQFQESLINFGSQDDHGSARKLTMKADKYGCCKDANVKHSKSDIKKIKLGKQPISSATKFPKVVKSSPGSLSNKSLRNSKIITEEQDMTNMTSKVEVINVYPKESNSKLSCENENPFSTSMDPRTVDLPSQACQNDKTTLGQELLIRCSKESLSNEKEENDNSRMVEKHAVCFHNSMESSTRNLPNSHCAEMPNNTMFLSLSINKEVNEAQKCKLCRKSLRKGQDSMIMNNDSLVLENSEVCLKFQKYKESIDALVNDPCGSQCASEKKKTGVCKKKARKEHLGEVGEVAVQTTGKGRGGKVLADGKLVVIGARTVLCWLIEMGVLSLRKILCCQSPGNNAVVKEGRITKAGILCKCCRKVLSISDFKLHAGFKVQKPSTNLFLKSGKSYVMCQFEAWSSEYKMRKDNVQTLEVEDKNDDTCRLCGDGGRLICCDSCPSVYHQACLCLQELPEGCWYCPICTCAICGFVDSDLEGSSSNAIVECSQCELRYHEACIKEWIKGHPAGYNTRFCGQKCLEVYVGLHSAIGATNYINDGFSWSILKCNHDDQIVNSAQNTAFMVECNTKLAIALSIMEKSFLPMLDPRTGNNIIPLVLYNWGSNFGRVNYQGFYTVVLEKDDELISVASIRVHGDTFAEMPLIATCHELRRKGMCRRLMHVIEELLKQLKVKMLLLPAIPEWVSTWISVFGFEPVDDADKQKLKAIRWITFSGTTLLKKNLHECKMGKLQEFASRKDMPRIRATADETNGTNSTVDAELLPSSLTSEITHTNSVEEELEEMNEFTEGKDSQNVFHTSNEKDPYSEALNSYKLGLGDIDNTNMGFGADSPGE
ncbi:hypothetical protein HPP92_009273 [Vanilla planifolia]|uniref:Uncharacterized protein n=1 Tax=Vanilla planifolia TaxID=51239 RepID=A0A835R692_VANPL|nr:hypothetical protein HPP92_009273 [Vanilla planifolia]